MDEIIRCKRCGEEDCPGDCLPDCVPGDNGYYEEPYWEEDDY